MSLALTYSYSIVPFSILQMRSGPFYIQRRNFAGKLQLTYDLIQERVILVLQLYDKVDPNKVLFLAKLHIHFELN